MKSNGHKAHEMFLIIVGIAVTSFCIVLIFFPRSRYSELEKRDLIRFPLISEYQNSVGAFTSEISRWFSDTEPFRDTFMTWSMGIRNAFRLDIGHDDNSVIFHASANPSLEGNELSDNPDSISTESIAPSSVADNAKIGESGIMIIGKGENVRALMAFGGTPRFADSYIHVCEEYAKALPEVRIYAMVVPLATEFYLPERASKVSKPQLPVLEYIKTTLSPNVMYVDVYSELAAHRDEAIYLRTDHHWAPLGAFYGARALAQTAGVSFENLTAYDRRVVHNYVGTMYGYSKDIAVKNAPEDFIYYLPRQIAYTTTYITYKLNEDYQVESQSRPYKGSFFHHFKDGSPSAYYTFMGGDCHLVKVETEAHDKRKLLIVKDSYGNLVPGYLFYSFSEIHVVDFRYFKNNMKQYVALHGITDLAICFNIFNACSVGSAKRVSNLLTQKNGDFSMPVNEAADSNPPMEMTDSIEERHQEVDETEEKSLTDTLAVDTSDFEEGPRPEMTL